MKGMSRHSQMAKIRSPGKHHKWKNDGAEQSPGGHRCASTMGSAPEANADPLGALMNSESGRPSAADEHELFGQMAFIVFT